jgi:hypothetical protein
VNASFEELGWYLSSQKATQVITEPLSVEVGD